MKKAYSKPDILFEDFSLCTSIAAGCEETPFNHTESCGVKLTKGKILFGEGFLNCNKTIGEVESKYDKLCYHNPFDSYNVFNSL